MGLSYFPTRKHINGRPTSIIIGCLILRLFSCLASNVMRDLCAVNSKGLGLKPPSFPPGYFVTIGTEQASRLA